MAPRRIHDTSRGGGLLQESVRRPSVNVVAPQGGPQGCRCPITQVTRPTLARPRGPSIHSSPSDSKDDDYDADSETSSDEEKTQSILIRSFCVCIYVRAEMLKWSLQILSNIYGNIVPYNLNDRFQYVFLYIFLSTYLVLHLQKYYVFVQQKSLLHIQQYRTRLYNREIC